MSFEKLIKSKLWKRSLNGVRSFAANEVECLEKLDWMIKLNDWAKAPVGFFLFKV